MAIGTPTERYAQHRAGQGATTTLSPTGTIVVGSFLILASGAAKIISSVADDSGGNTWAVDRAFLSGASRGFSFASMQVETQLTTGSVITITWADATSLAVQIWLQEVTGIATSSAFDTSATGSGTGTAVSTSSTGTLAQADEIVFGGFRTQNISTWTKGGTYTDVSTPLLNGQSSLEYKIVAATTGVLADGTFSVSGTWGGVVATYKGAAAAATEDPFPYVDGGYYPTQG